MDDCKLTTMDNPWNPFTHPRDWLRFDVDHGYNTQRWIAFCALISPKMDDEMYEHSVEDAMDEVLNINPFGIHLKVYKSDAPTLIPMANKAYKEWMESEKE